MKKSIIEMIENNMEVIEQYHETFGENSGLIYIRDINKAVEIYQHCLEVGKSYEEFYGEHPKDVIYQADVG